MTWRIDRNFYSAAALKGKHETRDQILEWVIDVCKTNREITLVTCFILIFWNRVTGRTDWKILARMFSQQRIFHKFCTSTYYGGKLVLRLANSFIRIFVRMYPTSIEIFWKCSEILCRYFIISSIGNYKNNIATIFRYQGNIVRILLQLNFDSYFV